MNKMLAMFGIVVILAVFVACGDDAGGGEDVFTVTYDVNGGTGTAPTDSGQYTNGQSFVLAAGTGLTQGGFLFLSWGTNAAGSGKRFAAGDSLAMGTANIILYAQYGFLPEMIAVPAKRGVSIGWDGVATLVHTVASISAFSMGKYEVTWALWTNVRAWAETNGYTINAGRMGSVDGGAGMTRQHPVTMVNHRDVLAWCNALSERAGLTPVYYTTSAKTIVYRNSGDSTSTLVVSSTSGANECVLWTANGYRLPTEAEWEYAARRKGDGSLSDGDKPAGYAGTALWDAPGVLSEWGPYAWYIVNSESVTHIVGDRSPNALGFRDMSGNVFEWCWDWYGDYTTESPYTDANTRGAISGGGRVIRGGSWALDPGCLQAADRYATGPGGAYADLGFRLSRTE